MEPVEDDYAANGIETRADGTSLQTTDVFNNVIINSGRCFCGNPAGISTFTPTGANGRFNIVGNTIHRTADPFPGIWVIASEPTTQVVNIFNNSFSGMDGPAFRLPENSPGLKVQNGYNNIFNAGAPDLGDYKLGPHTTNLNPRYRNASEDNFRLNGSSPLIDRGRVCQTGGLGRSDAARHFRLARASVDIGAYEYGSNGAPPTGRNLFGTGGANALTGIGGRDILCGLGGRDVLRGKGAADWVEGGDGRDRSYGQGGADIVRAGTGKRDLAAGGPGPDLVVTKDGSRGDLASGGKSDDTCRTDRRDRRELLTTDVAGEGGGDRCLPLRSRRPRRQLSGPLPGDLDEISPDRLPETLPTRSQRSARRAAPCTDVSRAPNRSLFEPARLAGGLDTSLIVRSAIDIPRF